MLKDEIEIGKRSVRTDAYQMSIGEIVSMYREGDLIIDPEFQRLFRWELGQKSRLIESILLGIPLPSIFVFETQDARWELVDGLQRISTILEFMGLLKGPDGLARPPSYLEGTKYLPSLNNTVWEPNEEIRQLPLREQLPISKDNQLAIRRARISVEILKRPSDNNTKYDLFQRLNAAGTPANAQELRNCIIIMSNPRYFAFLKHLSGLQQFREVINLNEEQAERQKDLEYVSRFLTYVFVDYEGKLDVEEYIDDSMKSLAQSRSEEEQEAAFSFTFETLHRLRGANALRRQGRDGYQGRSTLAAFECIATGIGKNFYELSRLQHADEFIENKLVGFWRGQSLERFSSPGLRGTVRIQRTIQFGAQWFRP